MESRRDFLKLASLLAAGGFGQQMLPAITRAAAIDPEQGSTYLDAEHVVILMQENRSFDHLYGTLRGVRGYNDPRAITQPGGNPVWLQASALGAIHTPFHFDIRNSNATWLGSLPHGWEDSNAARNGGRYDGWIPAKAATDPIRAHLPLTMGYYTREDLPFYYALADAFTVCDQNFSSSLTATEPNRLHMWTGTVRAEPSIRSFAYVRNDDMGYDKQLDWTTFPDRLEQQGISWRIYQNELSLPSGLTDEEDKWLSNFDDNTLEYFSRYHVRFTPSYRRWLAEKESTLVSALEQLNGAPQNAETAKRVAESQRQLDDVRRELSAWTDAAFAALPEHERNLHRKGFITNEGDLDFRALTPLRFQQDGVERSMNVPKGDVLHQFRQDVQSGKLPAVSWIVAPEAFSDHPSSAWFGAWYVSEALNILTSDPEVWKKTIFILCYDENDGYFDHVPPFVPPQPRRTDTGKVSAGIDPSVEYVSSEQIDAMRQKEPDWPGKPGPIGLGFRVPLVIASPWSRGGYACSQVFDHTSILQFLEVFLNHKQGQLIRETNISAWRRTVCGDLTSAFRPWSAQRSQLPEPVRRDPFLISIQEAKVKPMPGGMEPLTQKEIEQVRRSPRNSPRLPEQENGIRPACALPYELTTDGALAVDKSAFTIKFAAGRRLFGERASGAPFRVYTPERVRGAGPDTLADTGAGGFETGRSWDYAVAAGDKIADHFPLRLFDSETYHLCVYGPNGFFREFRGDAQDPRLIVSLLSTSQGASLKLVNRDSSQSLTVTIDDLAYGDVARTIAIAAGSSSELALNLVPSFGWYDLRIRVAGAAHYEQRYAGKVEMGRESFTDPSMGTRLL
ncbi:phospholipase C [Silvibacterium bohemicum]|uniref:phospholipase C n=1 Tax=Silvibacterium bohemicum TaxID=1577686 RepID=A0A841JQ46_9BACT|nr:phospholipase C, phosphocholine-specific [Silvibacterium bohemicum]MBB6142687.1 phospholipase C [Silvibacterium bohemicum]